MNFQKIEEYQKVDRELTQLNAQASNRAEAAAYMASKKALNEIAESDAKLQAEAGALVQAYNPLKARITEIENELAGYDGILEDVQDSVELEHYQKKLNELISQLNELERKTAQLKAKIDGMSEKTKKLAEQKAAAVRENKKAEEAFLQMKAALQPQADDILRRLKALRAEAPKELMALYDSHKKTMKGKMQVFVKYPLDAKKAGADCCPACGLELAYSVKAALKAAGDYTECPDCHHILYVPE